MKIPFFLLLLATSSGVAAAQPAPGVSSGDYVQDFDRLITEIRGVTWSAEFCTGTFPERKAAIDSAYADWRAKHAKLIAEMEGQFDVMDAFVQKLPEEQRGELKVSQYKWEVDNRRDGVRQQFVAMGINRFGAVCDAFPRMLRSPGFDFEVSRAALVENIRKGPLPLAAPQVMPVSPAPAARKEPLTY